jgi:hypothetical protein
MNAVFLVFIKQSSKGTDTMAIKKLTFSFEVPVTQLLGLIATGNTGLKIDVLGDDKVHHVPRLMNGQAQKLLEGPKTGKHPKTNRGKDASGKPAIAWQRLLEAFAKNPDHTKGIGDLGTLLEGFGLSKKSVSPQLSMMQKKGWLKRLDAGVYQMTAKGGVMAQRLGFHIADRKLKTKKKSKDKPAPPAEPVTVTETDHG